MDSVAVDRFSALRVFPLSISAIAVSDGWAVNATMARACDLIDVLGVNAGPTAVILNVDVGQTTWQHDGHPWQLRRIAQHQHVQATVSDIGWASLGRDFDNDLLVISWSDLPRLLDGWSPIGIDLFDQPSPPAATDELVLTVNTGGDEYLLDRLGGATVYYSGHDDCYVYIQTTDPALPSRLFARLLALLAGGSLLDEETESVVVPHPGPHLIADLLHQSDHWTGTHMHSAPGHSVTVGLTPRDQGWRLGDDIHTDPSHLITFDTDTGTWRASAN